MIKNHPASSENNALAAYLRDSGGDDQDLSINQQENAIRRWAAENGYTITRWFKDEARRGSSIVGRDGFQAMIAHFRNNAPEAGVAIWKLSRFARDIDDAQFYKADLRRRGYRIISINDNIPEGPEGRLFEAALDWMNAQFLADLSTDVKRGLYNLVEVHGAMPGNPPAGYKREPIHLGRRRDGREHIANRWVPDPDTWPICEHAWRLRAAGATYRQINDQLHLFGSLNSYKTFFSNRIYLGELNFGDLVKPNYFPPMIDQATWDTVQLRADRHRTLANRSGPGNIDHPRRQSSSYILSGLVYCAKCGAPLSANTVKQRSVKPGNVDRWQYYACTAAGRTNACDARNIPKKALEDAILNTLTDYIVRPDILAAGQAVLQVHHTDHLEETIQQRKQLAPRLAGVRRRISNISDTIAEHGQSRGLIVKLRELEAEETDLAAQVARLDETINNPPQPLDFEHLEKFCSSLRIALQNAEQPEILHRILSIFIQRIEAARDGYQLQGTIYYCLPRIKPHPSIRPPPDEKLIFLEQMYVGAPTYTHKFFTKTFHAPIRKRPHD